jgi:hypothetical protein
VRAGPGAVERVGSIRYQASAVLYLLLLEHPIDRRGRCRSCPRVMIGLRPRPCQIHLRASDWLLRYPDEALLLSHLARELGAGSVPSPGAAGTPHRSGLTVRARTDPRDIDVLPKTTGEPRIDPPQTPAVPSALPVREAGGLDPTHGGTGVHPDGPRFRRVPPPDGPPPSPGRSLVITGGMPWPR